MQATGKGRGVTLLEMCVVMAISSVVVGATMPGLQGFVESRRLNGVASQLVTDIQYVRTEAVARNRALRLTLHTLADPPCYVVHSGSAAQCSCGPSGPAVCTGGAEEIKTVHLPPAEHIALLANVGSVLFDPLHGTSTPTGTLRLVGSRGLEIRHVINIMGRVRSCSPLALVSGYRAC